MSHLPPEGRRVKPNRRKLTPQQEADAARAYDAGGTLEQLSARFGVSVHCLCDALDRQGRKRRTRRRLSDDEEAAVARAYLGGESQVSLAARHGCSQHAIHDALARQGAARRSLSEACRVYPVDEAAFDGPLTDERAYFVGLMMSDGWLSRGDRCSPAVCLELQEGDAWLVERFREFLKAGHPVIRGTRRAKLPGGRVVLQRFAGIKVRSARLVESLGRYGVGFDKSYTARARGGVETLPAFWRGVIDGDGTLAVRPDKSAFGSNAALSLVGSESLLAQFLAYVKTVVADFAGRPRRDHRGQCWGLEITGMGAVLVAGGLYDGAAVALPRKQALAADVADWGRRFRVRARERGPVACRLPGCGREAFARRLCREHLARPDLCAGLRKPRGPLKSWAALTREEMLALYRELGTWGAVARALSMPYGSVVAVRRRLGIP